MQEALPIIQKTPQKRSRKRCIALFLALSLTLIGEGAHAGAILAADHQDGYAGSVLEKVSQHWSPPNVKGNVSVRVRVSVDGRGRFSSCTPVRSSGYPALDSSACEAAKQAAEFGTPPYSMPLDVYLAFWTGLPKAQRTSIAPQQTQAPITEAPAPAQGSLGAPVTTNIAPAPGAVPATSSGFAQDAYGPQYKRYFSNVVWKLRNSIFIPVEARPGKYRITVRLDVDTAGNIKHYDIVSSSGDAHLDRYVRQGLKRAGSIPAPPPGLGSSLDITLTLTR